MIQKPQREATRRRKEDWGLILDVFDAEKSPFHRRLRGKIAQILGEIHFTLLEALLRENVQVDELERVYIGPGPRDKVATIIRRVGINDLTSIARATLERAIETIITSQEEKWTRFFNEAGPITRKLHSLELLPGIGKKKMWKIVQEREKRRFGSFRDIEERTGIDPVKSLTKRVLEELSGEEKYRVVTVYG